MLSQYSVITVYSTIFRIYLRIYSWNAPKYTRNACQEYTSQSEIYILDPGYGQNTRRIHCGIHASPPKNTVAPTIFSGGQACRRPPGLYYLALLPERPRLPARPVASSSAGSPPSTSSGSSPFFFFSEAAAGAGAEPLSSSSSSSSSPTNWG